MNVIMYEKGNYQFSTCLLAVSWCICLKCDGYIEVNAPFDVNDDDDAVAATAAAAELYECRIDCIKSLKPKKPKLQKKRSLQLTCNFR